MILVISNLQKVIKLVVFIALVSYFLGMFWYIYCKHMEAEILGEHEGFISYFNIDEMSDFKKGVVVTYWAFTTLSTVGFGDYYPITDEERIFISFILLFGVIIFSYIMNQLTNVLTNTM